MDNKLFLGIAREDITPEVGGHLYGYRPDVFSESVNDGLNSTAFAFSFGDIKTVFISVDICVFDNVIQKEIREEISSKLGIPFENIILSATHTHSGPATAGGSGWGDMDVNYINSVFKAGIVNSAVNAFSKLEPVTVAINTGDSLVGINRRELDDDNRATLGQNPWGAFNPKMTVISFKNNEGNVVGNIISYGCHGTSAGTNHEITRDWCGIMVDAVEAVSGGITAFFNGPEGDIGPRISNGKTIGDINYTKELGVIAARDALSIYNKLPEYKEVELFVDSGEIKLPVLPRISLEEAKEKVEFYNNPSAINIGRKRLDYFERVVASYDKEFEEKEFKVIPYTVLKIDNVVFVASPFELFAEINLRIDKKFENLNVIILSNANGHGGYFPTQSDLCRGGYEIMSFMYGDVQPYPDDADFHYIKEVVKIIENIK